MTLKRYIPGAILLMLVWTITISAQNLTEQENAEPGSRAWRITPGKEALKRQIEGYASEASVNIGQPIKFYVNVTDGSPTFRIDIFRLGWYQGAGGRLLASLLNLPAIEQPIPEANHETGLAECAWTMPANGDYQWTPPANGRYTGFYVAKLTASSSKQSYIPFVVRADNRQSPYLFQTSMTTWQAYNYWPENLGPNNWKSGKSLYEGHPNPLSWGPKVPEGNDFAEIQARKVSFNRPYYPDNGIYGTAGQFFFRGEYNMVKWLEKEGYDVAYTTNIDIDAATDMINGPLSPGNHKVFLSVGHDEYWSWKMRNNIEKARNRTTDPLNLGFFGGNAVHWQIRFENSSPGSSPGNKEHRTIVAYKHLARSPHAGIPDPYYSPTGSENNYLTTDYWRYNKTELGNICPPPPFENCFKDPEDELVGVMTDLLNVGGEGSFKFYAGEFPLPPPVTWPKVGINDTVTPIFNIIGYEADRVFEEHTYSNRGPVVKIGDSDFVGLITTRSHAVFFKMTGAGRVFGAGTIGWSYALDQFGRDPDTGPVYIDHTAPPDPRADILTRNILACLNDGIGCG